MTITWLRVPVYFVSFAVAAIAAVVLAGDVSLGSAVLAGDWVSSHDRLGRNRP